MVNECLLEAYFMLRIIEMKGIIMKKIISLLVVVAIVAAGIIFIPKIAHTCDDCEKFFIGAGYEPNIVTDLISDEEQIICKKCAEDQHAISIAMGKTVDEFKRDLFE